MFLYSSILPEKLRLKLHEPLAPIRYILQLLHLQPRGADYAVHMSAKPEIIAAREQKARRLADEKEVINVAFQIIAISKWKTDSLFELMVNHPRFNPVVWFVPYCRYDKETIEKEYRMCCDYFQRKGQRVVRYQDIDSFPVDERPDITFVHEPYVFAAPYNKNILNHLFCYIPYGYVASVRKFAYDSPLTIGALSVYVDCPSSAREIGAIMTNHGKNVVPTGLPMGDPFLFPNASTASVWKDCGPNTKKVIWAPHWTLDVEQGNAILLGTFLKTASIMTELAQKYAERIQFAFKPHPLLFGALCIHKQWGREKAQAFYDLWANMPNTQLEEGEYTNLFLQSDAIVHDSSSFTVEYLLVDKPCMYLDNPDTDYPMSSSIKDALACYIHGTEKEEIEDFLQMVLRGEDRMASQRAEYRQTRVLPPNGVSAAQNIVNHLLDPRFPYANQPLSQ